MQTTDTSVTRVQAVDTHVEVQEQVNQFRKDGYLIENIFVLTHDRARTKRIAERTDAETIGVAEEGLATTIANIFRSKGEGLRAKMRSLGISEAEAARLETEMDHDRIVVIAWGGREYGDDDFDKDVSFQPYPGRFGAHHHNSLF